MTATLNAPTPKSPTLNSRLAVEQAERRHVPKRSGKPDPTAHLSAEQVEALGRELDALRQQVFDSRDERDAAYIRTVIRWQRSLEMGSRAVLLFSLFPPAWVLGTVGLSVAKILENMEIGHNVMHGQWDWMRDPKIHSQAWEWDNASPSDLWKHSHNELHHTFTNVLGRDNDLGYGIMRVDEDQRWYPAYLLQPLWNFMNMCVFEYGIAAYDLEIGKHLAEKTMDDPTMRANAKKVLRKIRGQVTKDYVVHPLLSGPVVLPHRRRERGRQPRAQRVDALGDHVRSLPRGRRDLRQGVDRGRDPRRVVPAADDRLGQHQRQQGHAPDDRQPLVPDRAPPVPGHAQQPVLADRAADPGHLRAVPAQLHHGHACRTR